MARFMVGTGGFEYQYIVGSKSIDLSLLAKASGVGLLIFGVEYLVTFEDGTHVALAWDELAQEARLPSAAGGSYEVTEGEDPQLAFDGVCLAEQAFETRDLLRSTARKVGEFLASKLGYRGMFSIDGILSDGTFHATELNPRHASGLGLRAARPDFPIYLFHRGVQASLPGLSRLSSTHLEQSFCALIRSNPSHSIDVPARAERDQLGPHGTLRTTFTSSDALQQVDYTREKDSAELRAVEPSTENGLMSGVACALARYLTGRPLWCFANGLPQQETPESRLP